jgi:hypothetical protein
LDSCKSRRTTRTALRNASADWKRWSGDFAIEVRMIWFSPSGMYGRSWMGGVGAWLMCAAISEKLLSPWNGRSPVTISYSDMPRE